MWRVHISDLAARMNINLRNVRYGTPLVHPIDGDGMV